MDREQEYEELLYDLMTAKGDYEDMRIRADWVKWSAEAEEELARRYFSIKHKILNIMLGKEEEDD